MSALVAIIGIFIISALGVIAVIVHWLRLRALQERKPHEVKPKRRKRGADIAAEPKPEPLKKGRSRLISAASLAEAEAANMAPDGTTIEPAAAEPVPLPLPGKPGRSLLEAAARQAIVFRQHFPPHLAPEGRSFFGGTPYVPGMMEWPRDPASGKALHFIMQVDLAAVPAKARLGLLPDVGVLAVFLDLEWGAGDAYRIVWQRGYEGMPWRELVPPTNLALAYGDEAADIWPWALTPEHGTQLLPRWPFEPVSIALPEAPEDGAGTASFPSWSAGSGVAKALLAAQEQGGEPQTLPKPLSLTDLLDPDGESLVRPWPGFPQDWMAIQTVSAALVRTADRALGFPRRSLYPELDDAARAARVAALREEAKAWFDRARSNPALGSVAPPVRTAFWDWFTGHKALSHLIAPTAVAAAIETTLHALPHESANIPPEMIARLAYRHVLAQRSADCIHAPAVPDRMLAPFSAVRGEEPKIAATHLLLLALSSNEAIGHRFGEGVYQFWITPEDLADRLFDRVVLTRAAH